MTPGARGFGASTHGASVNDACLQAEAKLREAGLFLLNFNPQAVERCQEELRLVIAMLEGLVDEGSFQANPGIAATLLRIRRSAQALRMQIRYASNLYSGWIQLRLGSGYTRQGLPFLANGSPGTSFEV
jgi:hypothetical protein